MDMNNLPIAEIISSNIDVEPINQAIKQRAQNLSEQLPPDAAAQFVSDMSAYQCSVSSDGSNVSFKTEIESSYLIEYLKSHGTPVSGGEDGTAHNLDGTTYESKVDPDLWGTPLPWYELPTLQGEDEVKHLIEIMAPDAVNAAAKLSIHEIAEAVSPYVKTELEKALGGDY